MGLVLPSYPAVQPPEWCARYIGIPYLLTGRSRESVDCWGLCWLVLVEQFGRDAPLYEGVVWARGDGGEARANCGRSITAFAQTQYDPVEAGAEQPGDIIVLRIGGHPLHCGIIAAPGWMLHCTEGAETALERYDEMVWRNRVEGIWRLR